MTRRALRDRNRPDRIDVAEAIDRAVNGCTLPVAFSKEALARRTEDIAREALPADIKHLLNRLDRLEAQARAKGRHSADELSD